MQRRNKAAGLAIAIALTAIGHAAVSEADTSTPAPLTVELPGGLSPRTVGYYLAQQKGFFTAAGVAVTFDAPSGDRTPSDALVRRKADLAVETMPVALQRREAGDRIVHIAQVFRKAGMELVCRASVDRPAALKNRVVGVWFDGLESSFYAWMSALDLNPFGGAGSVTVLRQNREIEAFQRYQADCATTTTYAAPLQFAAAGIPLPGLKQYRYQELGQATLEDGIYAREADLVQPDRVALFAGFLAGARKGWQLAHDVPKTAFDLLRADPAFAAVDAAVLRQALDAVDDLVAPGKGSFGKLDPDAYDRTINLLLTAAPDPVLTKAPGGAISDVVLRKWK